MFSTGLASAERIGQTPVVPASPKPALESVMPVTLGEYFINTGAPQVNAGVVSFLVYNTGDKTHNFIIQGNGIVQATPDLATGDGSMLTVELTPGTYNLVCDISDHVDRGMSSQIVVVGDAAPAADPAAAATAAPAGDPAPAA
jgi:hypothetical protein